MHNEMQKIGFTIADIRIIYCFNQLCVRERFNETTTLDSRIYPKNKLYRKDAILDYSPN